MMCVTDPGNYRPISLLSNFNRIFKKVMFKRLKIFLDQNEILFTSQYGFRDKYSTQHAILNIVNTVHSNMDKKLYTCGIFIDLKKAFDTVNHSISLIKLHHYGIRGVVDDWFSSYLSGRVQTTEVEMNERERASFLMLLLSPDALKSQNRKITSSQTTSSLNPVSFAFQN